MQIMREIAMFFGKIYTAGTNFTRPLVVTIATNLNSVKVVTKVVALGDSQKVGIGGIR